ncbi:hypothetical protein JB92DRAFT_2798954 [Gautieria morchelliformis]|nr:hypothetical protein JB92DRAFT_2798954 [Gautieria morchelliformis]
MSKTAWSRSSSVPSDRIPPSRTPTPNRNKGKGKDKHPPKSKEVLRLESLLEGLKSWTTGKDPKGGCFCQARVHTLSKYTPICLQCGLVLCSLHEPFYPCPHCSSSVTSPASREDLVQALTTELSDVIMREAEQREQERLELQRAAGAFPTLATTTGSPQVATPSQPRKVLSLNAQTRKVTVASYIAAPVRARAVAEVTEEAEIRVPPPPKEVDYVRSKPREVLRWQNLRDGGMKYVPPVAQSTSEGSRSRRRRKKGVQS